MVDFLGVDYELEVEEEGLEQELHRKALVGFEVADFDLVLVGYLPLIQAILHLSPVDAFWLFFQTVWKPLCVIVTPVQCAVFRI